MKSVTFKESVCRLHNIKEKHYKAFVLRRSVFKRVRVVRPVVQFFHPDFLFHELRLIEKIADSRNLREIQEEVDFYQHKFVVNFVMKDALRFRLSGMRLMSLANQAFRHVASQNANRESGVPLSDQNPVNP
jgi:hypothetical protein